MTGERALENFLATYPPLMAIHNGQAAAGLAPNGWKAPYQTFFILSNPAQNRRIGVPALRIQLNNFAPDFARACQMSQLTADYLFGSNSSQGFSGYLGAQGADPGIQIVNLCYQDELDFYEYDTKLFNRMLEFILEYYA